LPLQPFRRPQRPDRWPDKLNQRVPGASRGAPTVQSTETRRGRPACGKAYFRPVFRDREGGSWVSSLRQVLGRLSPTTKSRSRRQPGRKARTAYVRGPTSYPKFRAILATTAQKRLAEPLLQ